MGVLALTGKVWSQSAIILVDPSGFLKSPWFQSIPVSKKPTEVRMGKGQGNVEYWVALVQPGKIMFEMAGVEEELAREAFRLASAKLPIKTHFIKKDL